jgi:antitoxin VapB
MALNIKSERADELARTLADRTGESITEAVTKAIEDRLAALDSQDAARQAREEAALDAIIARIKELPVLDTRSDDEIVGYDENGVWK